MPSFLSLERQLKAVASRPRLTILSLLKKHKSMTVSAIASKLQISHPSASHHLVILAAANIVSTRRRGKYSPYRLVLRQSPLMKQVLRDLR